MNKSTAIPITKKAMYPMIAIIPSLLTESGGIKPKIITKKEANQAIPATIHIPVFPPGI